MSVEPGDNGRRNGITDDALTASIYQQLRTIAGAHLAGERANHTLSATALVHEAYIRMHRPDQDPARFLHAAGEAMRRILIDHARKRGADKRGAGWERSVQTLDDFAAHASPTEVVALDSAFVRLEIEDARAAAVVRLRFYAGLSVDETAQALSVSRRSVLRDWEYARAFLLAALQET